MMSDAPTRWLVQQIQQHATQTSIWFSDENVLRLLPDTAQWADKPRLISNRWDITEQAKTIGFTAEFNDFDVSHIAANSIDHIFYRISKEKPVTHHLINEAHRLLNTNGTLWICGQKNEGIKTYIEKASALFCCTKHIQKDGMNYSGQLIKNEYTGDLLDDEQYLELRECLLLNEQPFLSKPGQFGWNKIDQGSEFLIAELAKIAALNSRTYENCLDLGCGYGYLTMASQPLFTIKQRWLTDNNAAALRTAQYNCERRGIVATVIASDAGQPLNERFDLILCNPPFHQGFSVDGDLTEKFLHNTRHLLANNGTAYFVVNQFIPLDTKAENFFKTIQLIAQNKSFKVFKLCQF